MHENKKEEFRTRSAQLVVELLIDKMPIPDVVEAVGKDVIMKLSTVAAFLEDDMIDDFLDSIRSDVKRNANSLNDLYNKLQPSNDN